MPSSTPSRPAGDARSDPRGKGRSDGYRVILLVAQDARRHWLRVLVAGIDPRCRIEIASNAIDASLHLTREHAQLLVLDMALEPGQSLAMIHLLARMAPSTSIVAFDESAACLPIHPYDVWSWRHADSVLRRAIGASRPRSRASSFSDS